MARITQTELSLYAHVARSAVAQWERYEGVTPKTQHLIDIAIATKTSLDWLATGRGPMQSDADNAIAGSHYVVNIKHYAQNTLEKRYLSAIRELPTREAQAIVEMIESISAQRLPDKERPSRAATRSRVRFDD